LEAYKFYLKEASSRSLRNFLTPYLVVIFDRPSMPPI